MLESHYSLQLPPGWEFKVPGSTIRKSSQPRRATNPWQWAVSDLKGIPENPDASDELESTGQMIVSFFSPGPVRQEYYSLTGIDGELVLGTWSADECEPSPEIKQQVSALTASKTTHLQKMQASGGFVQQDIRYVGIELGIGGLQPHPAPDVFTHRYGDCKDKATLMRSMLHEIGVDSCYVVINATRGAVTPEIPAHQDSTM